MYGPRLMECMCFKSSNNFLEDSFLLLKLLMRPPGTLKHLSPCPLTPNMVCFCNTNPLPDCTNRTHHHADIYPGEEIVTTIATVGYYSGTSPGTED